MAPGAAMELFKLIMEKFVKLGWLILQLLLTIQILIINTAVQPTPADQQLAVIVVILFCNQIMNTATGLVEYISPN